MLRWRNPTACLLTWGNIGLQLLTRVQAQGYLANHGVSQASTLKEILDGFDFSRAVYEQLLNTGDILYQFLRNPSFWDPVANRGNCYCMTPATRRRLPIFHSITSPR